MRHSTAYLPRSPPARGMCERGGAGFGGREVGKCLDQSWVMMGVRVNYAFTGQLLGNRKECIRSSNHSD